jgi:hypothetical protein
VNARGRTCLVLQMQAYALSGSLTREEMAEATGLPGDRVNTIIRDLSLRDQEIRNAEAAERVRRHSVPERYTR